MNALGVALDARTLISRGWTQPSDERDLTLHARDAEGRPCSPLSPKAARWTLTGALLRATNADKRVPQSNAVYLELKELLGGQEPRDWANSAGRTQREVVAVLSKVIDRMEFSHG